MYAVMLLVAKLVKTRVSADYVATASLNFDGWIRLFVMIWLYGDKLTQGMIKLQAIRDKNADFIMQATNI